VKKKGKSGSTKKSLKNNEKQFRNWKRKSWKYKANIK